MNRIRSNNLPAVASRPMGRLAGSRPGASHAGLLVMSLLWTMLSAHSQPSFSEHQVKALFLFNFAKYVDWPSEAFSAVGTPIAIGLIGQESVSDELKRAIEGKTINGRAIVVKKATTDEELNRCHILFVSSSESARFDEILAKVRTSAILTVGEHEQFIRKGGMINFIKKEGKIRLEIDLDAARKARLQISSKLLSVADVLKGKSK